MKILFLAAGISLLACNSTSNKTESSVDTTQTSTQMNDATTQDTGWVSLFDGQTLTGWHRYGRTAPGPGWEVSSGTIHMDTVKKKNEPSSPGSNDLVTNDEFESFDLKLEWKISKLGNSGIIFYVHEDTSMYKETYQTGPEMQVLDAAHPDAMNKHRAGDLYDLIASPKRAEKTPGEWNQVEIISNNGKLDFYLNGEHTVSTNMWDDNWRKMIAGSKFKEWPDFGTFKKGHIALQDHGNDVRYRNIMIKRL